VRDRSLDALLSTNRLRIFALDRYLETRAAYDAARAECERQLRFGNAAQGGASFASATEALRRAAAAEAAFDAADVDLQRFHRRLDIGCVLVSVGRLAFANDINFPSPFAFFDEHPNAREMIELRDGDWLRIWAPERTRILASGKLINGCKASPAGLALGTLPLEPVASWFVRGFPAEFAPVQTTSR
jgi:hypothetical protein